MLTKQRTVMVFARAVNGLAHFAQEDCDRQFAMVSHDWEDMGRPTVITLTVEPGDALNEGQ